MAGQEGPRPHLQPVQDLMVVEHGAEVHVGRELLQGRFLRRTGVEFLLPQEAKLVIRPLSPSSWEGILSLAAHTDSESSGLFKFFFLFGGGCQFY